MIIGPNIRVLISLFLLFVHDYSLIHSFFTSANISYTLYSLQYCPCISDAISCQCCPYISYAISMAIWSPSCMLVGWRIRRCEFFSRQRRNPYLSVTTQINGCNPKLTAESKYSDWNPLFTIVMKSVKKCYEIKLYKKFISC